MISQCVAQTPLMTAASVQSKIQLILLVFFCAWCLQVLHKGKSLHRYYLHQIHHFHSSILYTFLVVVLTCKYSLDFQCCGDYSFQRQLTGLLVLMSVLPLRYSSTSCRFPSRAARRNPAFPSLCKHTTHRSLGHCYHTHTNRIPSQHTHH